MTLLLTERTAVYLLFDVADELIYVGMTVNLDMRFGTHAVTKPWWPEVARREIEWYETRPAAERREASLIAKHHPRHNTIGTPRHAMECAERSQAVAARVAQQLQCDGPPEDPTAELLEALAQRNSANKAIALGRLLERLPAFAAYVRGQRQAVVKSMHEDDKMSWDEVGKAIKQHRTRAAQIARGVPGGGKRKAPPA